MTPLVLALVAPAHAVEFRWWGVGPTLGTRIIPLTYPIFPGFVNDADGDPKVDPVEGNLEIGLHAVLYAGNIGRIGLRGRLDTNFGPWFAQEVTLEYDHLLIRDGELQLMFGGGVGLGHERFGDDEGDDYLDNQHFPLRLQLTGLFRDKWRAYELDIYGTWRIIGASEYCVTEDDCSKGSETEDFFDTFGFYAGLGLEATVFFGNFRSVKN